MKRFWWIRLSVLYPCIRHKVSKPIGKRSFIGSPEHIMGAFILRLVLVSFLGPSSESFQIPRSGLLRILGLEQLRHCLRVIIMKVEVETP